MSSIIRVWLQFPTDESSLVQLSIIDIVSTKSPQSILFLDKVWETYKTPCATVLKKWNVHKSKLNIQKELESFNEQFSSHPFATPGSLEYQKEYLDRLVNPWNEKYDIAAKYKDMVG